MRFKQQHWFWSKYPWHIWGMESGWVKVNFAYRLQSPKTTLNSCNCHFKHVSLGFTLKAGLAGEEWIRRFQPFPLALGQHLKARLPSEPHFQLPKSIRLLWSVCHHGSKLEFDSAPASSVKSINSAQSDSSVSQSRVSCRTALKSKCC